MLVAMMMAVALTAAPSDEGLFPFVIRPDAEGSAMDMSALLPKPAGKNGFLRCAGEHFVDARGKTVRLNGINLTGAANFPEHAEADRLAAQFARLGFNCVRMHLFDAFDYANNLQKPQPCLYRRVSDGRATVVDEDQLDRLEYLIAALKKRGVFIDMNLHAARKLGPADGIRTTGKHSRGVNYFVRAVTDAEKQYAKDLLTHVNPYTGLSLAEDPAMALVELNNENALMQVYWTKTFQKQGFDPWYIEEFHRQREAAGYDASPTGINKFIIETEKRYFREMVGYVKNELGVKCPVYGTQHDYTAIWVTADTCDLTDSHIYWEGSGTWGEGAGDRGLTPPDVAFSFVNKPLVAAGLDNGWNMEHIIAGRGSRRVAGLPFITSECAAPYPGWYGAEYQPTIHAYAAFQDWAGVFAYSWNNETKAFPDFNPYFFSHAARPDCVAHFPASCAIFLRGDVAKAVRRIDVPVDVNTRFAMAQKNYTPLAVIDPDSASGGRVPNDVFLRHAVGVDLRKSPVPQSAAVAAVTNGTIVSDTREIVLHRAAGREGWFTVDVPNVKVLSGFLDGARRELGGVVFEPGRTKLGWCTISLVDQTGGGMRTGSRLLLAVTGYTHNGGAVFRHLGGDRWGSTAGEFGSGKVVTEGVPLKVTLPVSAAKCWALDESGARKGEVPVSVCDGRAEISVGPDYRTVWYEVSL